MDDFKERGMLVDVPNEAQGNEAQGNLLVGLEL